MSAGCTVHLYVALREFDILPPGPALRRRSQVGLAGVPPLVLVLHATDGEDGLDPHPRVAFLGDLRDDAYPSPVPQGLLLEALQGIKSIQ